MVIELENIAAVNHFVGTWIRHSCWCSFDVMWSWCWQRLSTNIDVTNTDDTQSMRERDESRQTSVKVRPVIYSSVSTLNIRVLICIVCFSADVDW